MMVWDDILAMLAAAAAATAEAAPAAAATTATAAETAAAAAPAVAQAGMFALPEAAASAAPSGFSLSGLFSQIPGVTPGSQQALMLAAQNEGMGGAAANMTAQSAMPAVESARQAGTMGLKDYLGNRAAADMAGMNDPSVWMDRLATNASRMSGPMAKGGLANMASSALSPRPGGAPMAPHHSAPPQQQPDVQQVIAAAKRGDPKALAMLRAAGIDPTRL